MKMSFLEASAFRAFFILTIIQNIIYTVIMYFLWAAIFESSPSGIIGGMTFHQTFIYLALAGSLSNIVMVYAEWGISRDIRTGSVAVSFMRPLKYRTLIVARGMGEALTSLVIMFVPCFLVVFFLAQGSIHIGINILFFIPSFILAALVSLYLDFIVGMSAFYTENIWGITTVKETIVLLLSGALIPISFFPEGLQKAVQWLPFQSIFNLPLQIIVNNNYGVVDYLKIMALQIFWAVVLYFIGELAFRKASKAVTVNGG